MAYKKERLHGGWKITKNPREFLFSLAGFSFFFSILLALFIRVHVLARIYEIRDTNLVAGIGLHDNDLPFVLLMSSTRSNDFWLHRKKLNKIINNN